MERVRSERIKKFDKPVETIAEEPTRHALLSQILAEPQDDTEEIHALFAQSSQPDIPYVSELTLRPDVPSFRSTSTQTSRFTNALRGIGLESVIPSSDILTPSRTPSRSEQRNRLLGTLPPLTFTQTTAVEPSEEVIQQEEEIPFKQPEPRGAIEMITQTEETTNLLPPPSSDEEKQILSKWNDSLDDEEFPESVNSRTSNTYDKLLQDINKYSDPQWKPT